MNKHFVIIVDSIDINDSSGSKANIALIKNLKEIAKSVIVLHYTQKNIQLNDIQCFSINEKKYNIFYFLSRMQRVIQRVFKVNLAKYLEHIFGFSFTFFNDANSIISGLEKPIMDKADIIVTLSKGASFRPHYAVNKLPHLHEKWLAYIHDPYPFAFYPPPYTWKEPGFKQKQIFFKEVSERAKFSAFPSLLLKDWMSTYFSNFSKTGIVIPHQNFDTQLNSFEKIKCLDISKFNLLHAGNLMKQRNPENLIRGFKLFLEKNPKGKKEARLLLFGKMSHYEGLIKKYNSIISELFIEAKNLSFNKVYSLQKKVSVNIILESSSEISPFLPGKFPHCITANKPILYLGPQNSETIRLLGRDYPFHSSVDDTEEIAKCIERLYNLWLEKKCKLELNRKDLEYYVSASYLNEALSKVIGD